MEDDSLVLEHHSNVIRINESSDELNEHELLTGNWKHPIIITTLVQLLNTLFDGKTTSIRRMNALCNSVIVFDETQSIPKKMFHMMNGAINFLSHCCNTTVVLCSATNPCFEILEHSLILSKQADMVMHDPKIWKVFKRTNVVSLWRKNGFSIDELADLSNKIMDNHRSLLIICNTKKEARDLYQQLKILNHNLDEPYQLFHLSTAMCMRHRLDVLERINACLEKNERIVTVATQLVEAGVDFSFACVIRVCAGLDNVAQAAGRCNRNGEFCEKCDVFIVNIRDENLRNLPDIQQAQISFVNFLYQYNERPECFCNDMLSEEAINYYYTNLFSQPDVMKQFDYPIKGYKLYDLLSANTIFSEMNTYQRRPQYVRQAFQTAGKSFSVFNDDTIDVIVEYDKQSMDIIADLYSEKAMYDIKFVKEKIALAQCYTISLYSYQVIALEKLGGISAIRGQAIYTLLGAFYDSEIGLSMEGKIEF